MTKVGPKVAKGPIPGFYESLGSGIHNLLLWLMIFSLFLVLAIKFKFLLSLNVAKTFLTFGLRKFKFLRQRELALCNQRNEQPIIGLRVICRS